MSTFELTYVPTGSAVRRFVVALTRVRTGASWATLMSEAVGIVVEIAVAVGLAVGIAGQIAAVSIARLNPPLHLPPGVLVATVAALAASSAWTVLTAIGPVNSSPGQAIWLLPTPIQRSSLVWPGALALAAGSATVAAVVALAGALMTGSSVGIITCVGALGGWGVVVAAGARQVEPRRLLVAGLAVATGAGLAALVFWPALILAAAALAGASWQWLRRLDSIHGADLGARGRVAAQAGTWIAALDSRELGALLSGRPRITTSRHFAWVRAGMTALVAADCRLLTRSRRRLFQLLVCVLVPVLVAAATSLLLPTVVCLLACGYAVGLIAAEGARSGERSPVLDRAFALSPRQVRLARAVVPGGCAAGWAVITCAAVFARSGALGSWTALALALAPTIAGAAVRAAYRKPPDWSGALVATPMGAVPTGLFGALVRGPDVYVLGAVPFLIAALVAGPSVLLIVVSASLSSWVCLGAIKTGLA